MVRRSNNRHHDSRAVHREFRYGAAVGPVDGVGVPWNRLNAYGVGAGCCVAATKWKWQRQWAQERFPAERFGVIVLGLAWVCQAVLCLR